MKKTRGPIGKRGNSNPNRYKGVMFSNSDMEIPSKEYNKISAPTQYYIDMPEEQYLALKGREKSKAAIIRASHARVKRNAVSNPRGKNQYTEENQINDYLQKAAFNAKAIVPDIISTIVNIAQNSNSQLNQLRACELLLSYTIAKPKHVEHSRAEGKTFIILPPEVILG